jgi:hypothetical protein
MMETLSRVLQPHSPEDERFCEQSLLVGDNF